MQRPSFQLQYSQATPSKLVGVQASTLLAHRARKIDTFSRIFMRMLLAAALVLSFTFFAQNMARAEDQATVTVAHFAAFAETVQQTEVEIFAEGNSILNGVRFGDIAAPLSIDAGTYLIEIQVDGNVAISDTFTLDAGVSYFLAAIGDGMNQPLELFALVNDTEADAENAKLRVAHLSPFAQEIGDTAVDICSDGTAVVSGVEFKGVTTPYLSLPPGDYDLVVSLAGTDCALVFDIPAITLTAGSIADAFAIGYPAGDKAAAFPFTIATSTGLNLATPATVTAGHFAAFADTVAETAVDIRVNGSDVFTNVAFGAIGGPVNVPTTLPASQYLVEIVLDGAVAISDTFTLESGVSYFVAAIGDGLNQPLELLALVNETEVDAENAKFRVAHLAPFAQDLGDTAVDICTNDGVPVFTGLAFGDVTMPYQLLAPGDYNLVVSVAGSNCASVFNIPAINFSAGDIVDVFAVGYPVGPKAAAFPFDLKTTTGFTLSAPVTVTVGHFAPFANDVAGTSVSIFINGTEALSNTVFGDVVTTNIAAGRVRVDVVPTAAQNSAAQAEPAISQVFTLTQGLDYSLFAVGGANGWELGLRALVNDRTPDANAAKVRLGHFAPFAEGIEGTSVAICTIDDQIVAGLAAVPYGVVTEEYLTLPPATYALKISAANDCATTFLELPVLALAAGNVIEVYATGTNTEAFPLAVVVIGEVETVQPPIVRTLYVPFVSNNPLLSIAAIAMGDPQFSTLVQAVGLAGLADTLSGSGDYTVFAPTNAAFEALPAGLFDQAVADPQGLLTQVLLYHVLGVRVPSSALAEGLTAPTLQGGNLTFSLAEGPKVNGANIEFVDIIASNGIIHVIDAVLLPSE